MRFGEKRITVEVLSVAENPRKEEASLLYKQIS